MPLGSDEETIAVLLKAIERIARKTSVHITNIRPRASKETELYKEFGFEVISEASLEGLLRFMYELQNAAELLRVKRSTLSLKAGKGKTLRAVFEISKLAVKTP